VTLTRVSAVTTPIHSQLYTLWLEQEYPSEVDDGVTTATAGSTDSRFSAANIASSGKGLRHALDRLQLSAANGTKIGTRYIRAILLQKPTSMLQESDSGLQQVTTSILIHE